MKVLIFGKYGQLGWELQRACSFLGEIKALDRTQLDFEHPTDIKKVIHNERPDIILNAAAYTAVDQAEKESKKAFQINAASVEILAEEAKALNSILVHYSTDYVFDGDKVEGYIETDKTAPLNIYGKSKCAGEEAITKINGNALIFRTSWVFAHSNQLFPTTRNFIKSMIELGQSKDQLKIVSDQYGAPTSAALIADITAFVLHKKLKISDSFNEIYHLSAKGITSWHAYAMFIFETIYSIQKQIPQSKINLKINLNSVEEISTDLYPVLAKRPKYSVLETQKLEKEFDITLPDWRTHVMQTLYETVINSR